MDEKSVLLPDRRRRPGREDQKLWHDESMCDVHFADQLIPVRHAYLKRERAPCFPDSISSTAEDDEKRTLWIEAGLLIALPEDTMADQHLPVATKLTQMHAQTRTAIDKVAWLAADGKEQKRIKYDCKWIEQGHCDGVSSLYRLRCICSGET